MRVRASDRNVELSTLSHDRVAFMRLRLGSDLFSRCVYSIPRGVGVSASRFVEILGETGSRSEMLVSMSRNGFVVAFRNSTAEAFGVELVSVRCSGPIPPRVDRPAAFGMHFSVLGSYVGSVSVFSSGVTLRISRSCFATSTSNRFNSTDVGCLRKRGVRRRTGSLFSLSGVERVLGTSGFSRRTRVDLNASVPLDLALGVIANSNGLDFLLTPELRASR